MNRDTGSSIGSKNNLIIKREIQRETMISNINEEIKELERSNYDHESQDQHYKQRENVFWHQEQSLTQSSPST